MPIGIEKYKIDGNQIEFTSDVGDYTAVVHKSGCMDVDIFDKGNITHICNPEEVLEFLLDVFKASQKHFGESWGEGYRLT